MTFALLVAAALYFRRRGGLHKRVMVLASCGLLLPPVERLLERIPLRFLHAGGWWEMIGFTEITPVACILYDTVKHQRLHAGFAWGGLALFSSPSVFTVIGGTNGWLNFMKCLLSR